MRCLGLIVLLACVGFGPQAGNARSVLQGPAPDQLTDSTLTFEVASVRPSESDSRSTLSEFRGGRFTVRYATLKGLIRSAYGKQELTLPDRQVLGGPEWLDKDRFDVVATAPNTPDSPRGSFPQAVLTMLRALLVERFHVRAHFETREYPLFALVLARRDGKLGPGLRPRVVPCTPAAVRDRGELFTPNLSTRRVCGGLTTPGTLTATGVTMMNLASALSQPRLVPGIDRTVVDRTGLTGTFDIDLNWTPEAPLSSGIRGTDPVPSVDGAPPPLFTALKDQLGLTLEPITGPVDVLIIDHAERPTPN